MFKWMYAYELAENLWGQRVAQSYSENMAEILYNDLEIAGYTWTRDSWLSDEYFENELARERRRRAALASAVDLEKLAAWQSGEKIKG